MPLRSVPGVWRGLQWTWDQICPQKCVWNLRSLSPWLIKFSNFHTNLPVHSSGRQYPGVNSLPLSLPSSMANSLSSLLMILKISGEICIAGDPLFFNRTNQILFWIPMANNPFGWRSHSLLKYISWGSCDNGGDQGKPPADSCWCTGTRMQPISPQANRISSHPGTRALSKRQAKAQLGAGKMPVQAQLSSQPQQSAGSERTKRRAD